MVIFALINSNRKGRVPVAFLFDSLGRIHIFRMVQKYLGQKNPNNGG